MTGLWGFSPDGIRINTDKVRDAATQLKKINDDMDRGFNSTKGIVDSLFNTWDGNAAAQAKTTFNQLKKTLSGSNGRKGIMDSYVKFLQDYVATGYDSTEDANVQLSELFK